MKIGIRFTDNDFATEISAFLSLFKYNNNELGNLTKEIVVEYFNKVAYSIYYVRYVQDKREVKQRTADYLKITTDNVYFNEEVDTFIEEECKVHDYENNSTYYWYNYEFHYFDSDVKSVCSV